MIAGLRHAALAGIAALVAAASAVSFAESYHGLYLWARGHGIGGGWAVLWPLQVDVFIAVGELALFVALADGWAARSRAGAWAVTLAGLAVSVAGNVGHVTGGTIAARATAAVPPVAAAAALAVGLGVLKRATGSRETGNRPVTCGDADEHLVLELLPGFGAAEDLFRAELDAGTVPSIRGIKQRMQCGYPAARQVQDHLKIAAAREADEATARPSRQAPAFSRSIPGRRPGPGGHPRLPRKR